MEKIKCLLVKENELPEIVTITNKLENLQKTVDGLIEYVYMENINDVILICNEEGKINGMGPNRDIEYDVIYGPFLVVGNDEENGDILSLNDEQIEKWSNYFNEENIERTNNKIQKIISDKLNYYI